MSLDSLYPYFTNIVSMQNENKTIDHMTNKSHNVIKAHHNFTEISNSY